MQSIQITIRKLALTPKHIIGCVHIRHCVQKPWLLEPLALSKFCATFIEQQVGGNLNEASLAHHIERVLPYNGILFLGNSLFCAFGGCIDQIT